MESVRSKLQTNLHAEETKDAIDEMNLGSTN